MAATRDYQCTINKTPAQSLLAGSAMKATEGEGDDHTVLFYDGFNPEPGPFYLSRNDLAMMKEHLLRAQSAMKEHLLRARSAQPHYFQG